jgi:Tfp pilus assembly protein PilF
MVRSSTHFRSLARKGGLGTRLALAAVLAGGMALGGTAFSAPAFAQDKKDGKPANTKAFAEAYQPVAAIVNAEGADYAAAKAQLPTVMAAVGNETDRNAAGQLVLLLGNKLSDKALQRQGLETMLQSGQVPAEQVGQFQFFVGSLAYEAKDWAAARTALQAAVDAGYTQDDPRPLIAETYFSAGQQAEGVRYLADLIKERQAAGQQVPDNWLLRGLKAAYEGKLTQQANEYSAMLVKNNPTEQNWVNSLQVIASVNQLDPQAELDLLRLMRETGALKQKHEFAAYVDAADPRRMANEVLAVLEEGVAAGAFTQSDSLYTQTKALAGERAAADRKEAPGLVGEARSSSTGITAQGVGDAFFSFGSYAEAADMYQVALEKGGLKDREMVLTRLGIAQAKAGELEKARASFTQVAGSRAPVAKMWLAYIDTKAG